MLRKLVGPASEGGLDLEMHMETLKNMFFLGRADLWGQFMDTAAEDFEAPVRDASVSRLESLLDLSVRGETLRVFCLGR